MPFIPATLVKILLSDTWDASVTLPRVRASTPMLFLSGKQDELVPPAQMKALRDLRASQKGKSRWRELDGTHNDTYVNPAYWVEIEKWLKEEIEGQVDEKAA